MTLLRRGSLLLAAALAAALLAGRASAGATARAEVVVSLDAPPLAEAFSKSRVLSARAKARRLDLRSVSSASYLLDLARAQAALERRIVAAIPSAQVRWRYRVTLDALAVVVPVASEARLAGLPGVASVTPSVPYHSLLDRSPGLIGAPTLWGPDFSTAGSGVKIGIIDDGVDQTHPFFDPAGYVMPPGFPKGDTAYTTAKVIVARAFPPPSPAYAAAATPFDPKESDHATHVAGIAAGNHGPVPPGASGPVSGIAPRAYIGNYKALTIPTAGGFGLDGNSAELAAAIEAAVTDGMDVINLSLGEPEVDPARDLVVQAINAAADAGVVPAIAAGNDFDEFGFGSIGSPGTAANAISVAAVSKQKVVADFSSGGPTPLSLALKPDLSAPGVDILSSVPKRRGTFWTTFSGTSMAAPHVAGAAALLRERHPTWTVAQIKSALVTTAGPAYADPAHTTEAPTTREGGGLIDLVRADDPRFFTDPATLSFGLVSRGRAVPLRVTLADAGNGAGEWAVAVEPQTLDENVAVSAPATVTVPGTLAVSAAVNAGAPDADFTGFLVLTLGDQTRRIPYWGRAATPALAGEPRTVLSRPGVYRGDTSRGQALVSAYRYPSAPDGSGVTTRLDGPEQVFRFVLRRPIANFGVVILDQPSGVHNEPRIVLAGNENRLAGYAALPLNIDPYQRAYGQSELVSGTVLPATGAYDIVFDSPRAAAAGAFSFRFWVNDTAPPAVKLLTPAVARRAALELSVTDLGSGVDPTSLAATIDGRRSKATWSAATGRATIVLGGLPAGAHTLVFTASDYQETKNMEDVTRILPNTASLTVAFRVR